MASRTFQFDPPCKPLGISVVAPDHPTPHPRLFQEALGCRRADAGSHVSQHWRLLEEAVQVPFSSCLSLPLTKISRKPPTCDAPQDTRGKSRSSFPAKNLPRPSQGLGGKPATHHPCIQARSESNVLPKSVLCYVFWNEMLLHAASSLSKRRLLSRALCWQAPGQVEVWARLKWFEMTVE